MLVDLNDFDTLDILMFINGVNGSIGAAQTNRALALTLAFQRFIVIARNFTCCHQTAMSDVINPRLQLNRNVERYFLQVFKRLRWQCDVTDIFHVDQCTLNKSTLQAHFVYVRSVQNRHPHQSDQPRGIGLTRTLPPVHACGAKRAGAGSAHPVDQASGAKGGLSLGVGVAGLSLFKGPLKDAMAYQNQLSNLNVLGMKQAEIAEVVGKAWQ